MNHVNRNFNELYTKTVIKAVQQLPLPWKQNKHGRKGHDLKEVGRLSGGEQQMLAISRALMARPRLLMVDELSLGLMPKAIDTCYEVLRRLASDEGLAVLMVDQSTDRALDVADAVCVIESGRVRWAGSGDDARRKAEEVRKAILGAA